MEVALYNQNAEQVGTVSLAEGVFGLPMNQDLLYQVVTTQVANKRINIAHTKDRSEVSGGGKKPWKQKGTGRARHGSIRSPIWKGGGVTFGPTKNKIFKKKINAKMSRKALGLALSSKLQSGQLILLDELKLEKPKTKEVFKITNLISGLCKDKGGGMLIVLPNLDESIIRSSKNIPKLTVIEARNLNALEAASSHKVVVLKDAVPVLEKKLANK